MKYLEWACMVANGCLLTGICIAFAKCVQQIQIQPATISALELSTYPIFIGIAVFAFSGAGYANHII